MILTGPKENYCFIEVSREIRGGAQFLGQLEGVAGKILGVEAVAATTQIDLGLNSAHDNLDVSYVSKPVIKPRGCEIPPPNELRLPLLHRGFEADAPEALLYPDTAHVKHLLKKAGLRNSLIEVAAKHGQEFEGATVWFQGADYLPNPGRSLILGLRLAAGKTTTRILQEQAEITGRTLRALPSFGKMLYRLVQPWNLAVAVARVEAPADSDEARILLDDIRLRVEKPVPMELGGIKFSSDDIG